MMIPEWTTLFRTHGRYVSLKTKAHCAKQVVYGGRQEPTTIYICNMYMQCAGEILRFIPRRNAKSAKLLALENEWYI